MSAILSGISTAVLIVEKVETGFYAEPNTNATFTCGLCGNDLLIVEVDHEKHEMVCEDMNEIIKNEIENYRKNH